MGTPASARRVPNAPEASSQHDYRATQPSVLTAMTLMSLPPEPAAHKKEDMQPKSAGAMEVDMKPQQEDCRVSPGPCQPAQQEDPLSKQASIGDANSCRAGSATQGTLSWEPRARYSKASLGQRTRASLDWDFQNDMPVVNTRRSKEYGDQFRRSCAGLGAGRT
ncbi:hypothetical protein ABBQ38_012403 [Trebouxia sp. C0009 RCD-2024]